MAPDSMYQQLPLFVDGDDLGRGSLVTVKRHLNPDALSRYPKLTERLLHVAELLAEEKSNSEIAERLRGPDGHPLKSKTIAKYVERLLLITDADSRAGIVMALITAPPDAPTPLRRVEEAS